jgi:hypothetical protein
VDSPGVRRCLWRRRAGRIFHELSLSGRYQSFFRTRSCPFPDAPLLVGQGALHRWQQRLPPRHVVNRTCAASPRRGGTLDGDLGSDRLAQSRSQARLDCAVARVALAHFAPAGGRSATRRPTHRLGRSRTAPLAGIRPLGQPSAWRSAGVLRSPRAPSGFMERCAPHEYRRPLPAGGTSQERCRLTISAFDLT